MFQSQIEQVRRTSKNFYDVAERAAEKRIEIGDVEAEGAGRIILESDGLEALAESPDLFHAHEMQEAIILSELRPAYFVLENGIDLNTDVEGDPDLVALINSNKAMLETVCQSVGRVDLVHHWSLPYGGTGFLIGDNLAVTNRHVARLFGEAIWNGFRFKQGRFGQQMEARLDYRHLHQSASHKRAEVEEILYIASDLEPDFALLKVRNLDDVAPLTLSSSSFGIGHPVAVVGYPAEDADRNDKALMDQYFGDVYQVKRFAPGFVTGTEQNDLILMSDYTSMGGNSGSAVCCLESGDVIGLHFAGRFKEANYAVSSDILDAARRQVSLSVQVPAIETEAPTTPASNFGGRNGYKAEFLGVDDLLVELPRLGLWAEDIAPVHGTEGGTLRYQNFSVVQSASRRLPLVTAVNIDGGQSKRLRRKGTWKLDGRLAPEHQIANELYRYNPLDRGHMVRRRDPGWGPDAQRAEIDTFHYTNCVPQHKHLNQRDWVGLEDYILEAAETRDFKVSIFTGPVFRDSDKKLKVQPGAKDIQIPEEFWKIAVMVNDATGELSATGYVLSHGPFIRDMVESPFVYGSYRTYQVQIARIQNETGLIFGRLTESDPLGVAVDVEAPFSLVAIELDGPDSLVLSRPPATV